MNRSRKQLALRKETLVELTSVQIDGAVGGALAALRVTENSTRPRTSNSTSWGHRPDVLSRAHARIRPPIVPTAAHPETPVQLTVRIATVLTL